MSDARRACCGPCGPGPGGCDLDACVEVVFSGINMADLSGFCNTDPDCDADPGLLLAAYGINPTIRVQLTAGSGSYDSFPACKGRVVWRASLDPACAVNPGQLSVARGLFVAVETVCVDGEQRVTSVFLGIGGLGCSVGMDEVTTGFTLFRFGTDFGSSVPFGTPVPNLNSTDPLDNPSPVITCPAIGVGGTATVNFASGACDQPTLYDIAERCDDPMVTILVDGDAAPAGHYGITYLGENYRLTGRVAAGTPVSVTWTEAVCPPDPGKGPFKGVRCRNTGPATLGPPEVAYFADPGIGAGNGTLSYYLTYTEPVDGDCTILRCTIIVRYRPTTDPATPGAPILAHQAGVACAQQDLARCFLTGCPPGVADPPFNPCAQPDPPSWCIEAEGGGGMMAMGGLGATASFATEPAWQARQVAHLSTALGRQAKAANCRGCGDTGMEGLA